MSWTLRHGDRTNFKFEFQNNQGHFRTFLSIFPGQHKIKIKDISRTNDFIRVISRIFKDSVLELVPSSTHKIYQYSFRLQTRNAFSYHQCLPMIRKNDQATSCQINKIVFLFFCFKKYILRTQKHYHFCFWNIYLSKMQNTAPIYIPIKQLDIDNVTIWKIL